MQHLSVEQVKASVRIEEVVRRRGVELHANQSGERLVGHCPFHQFDETPSFNVYVGSQRYHCFGCGADGDVIDFVQAFDVCSWREALHRLSANIIVLPTAQLARTRQLRPVLPVPFPPLETEPVHRELLTAFQQHYHQTLLAHPLLMKNLQRERGITEEGIKFCGLGYADGSALREVVCDSEQREEAVEVGLLGATGRERLWQRLIIPESLHGHCCWMIGRTLCQPARGTRSPRYLGISLSKPLLGYGLALQRLQERHLVRAILVVEGAIDYVIASQWHLPVACVALVGTHASMRQLITLLDLQQRAGYVPLLISLDADDAGRQASRHLLAQLRQRTSQVVELTPIAGMKDIGELGVHPQGYALLYTALERALTRTLKGASR